MTKRLILTGVVLCGLLCCGVAEARVCLLGEAGCEGWGNQGAAEGTCSAEYKGCTDPRSGAAYCGQKVGSNILALYKEEDCCALLPYKECPEEDNEVGYGKSCRGAKSNKTFWEFCGCGFGFIDTNPDAGGSTVGSIYDTIKDEEKHEIPYLSRCSFQDDNTNKKCKLAICNTERRWFYTREQSNNGDHCVYRLPTRCGGLGCEQLYDCNNSEDYYRSENLYFRTADGSIDNYIAFSDDDPWSNEKDKVKATWVTGGLGGDGEYTYYKPTGDLPYGRKIISYDDAGNVEYDRYNITNRIVCGYEGHAGTGHLEDVSGGLDCNGIKNFCFKYKGCNTVRGWYKSSPNLGVLYGETGQVYGDYSYEGGVYETWMNEVERNSAYDYRAVIGLAGASAVGESFDLHAGNYALRESFFNIIRNYSNKYDENTGVNLSHCGMDGSPCRERNEKYGCTYITHACHKSSENCYKRIGCSEENRFYHSFINAGIDSFDANGGGSVDKNGINVLYNSSLNGIYWMDFYGAAEANGPAGLADNEIYPACVYEINACNDTSDGGIYGGGCYRKSLEHGCISNFEDIRKHILLEQDWLNWFKDWRPICNDNTRCYQASACDLAGGSYSSEPNTSFFFTIHSTATMSTCYRGANCHFDAGVYSSVPNVSFFYTIESFATGSQCYRGQNCNTAKGAYSSLPNTSFFITIDSIASGSICYRGENCREDAGVYSSEPNTVFFKAIQSEASGSTCYRGENCAYSEGAYSSIPNTSFFITIHSEASSSLCYRGESCAVKEIGAYSSEPNTSFFKTIQSEASGSTCYRGEDCHYDAGAYSSMPNTVFFTEIHSEASGSTCYRAECCTPPNCELEKPDTSFFLAIYSEASGFHTSSACYRAPDCHYIVGAYSSTPNTSFFSTVTSVFGVACQNARGRCPGFDPWANSSRCYRSSGCQFDMGAYSSSPNTSFFITIKSISSGSNCYRGLRCHREIGAYSSTPNTSFFFEPLKSIASGSECYRRNDNQICNNAAGSYRSDDADAPLALNTSYFHVVYSLATGTTCYRTDRCHREVGAYSSSPNTSFFSLVSSAQSWKSICYRAHGCNESAGARKGEPCSSSDKTLCFTKEAVECMSGTCFETKDINPKFFKIIFSNASGSTCYRGDRCNIAYGAYTSEPNTSFFVPINSQSPEPVRTRCYRGQSCNLDAGVYTSVPNTSFFSHIISMGSGSTCYRVKDCAYPDRANNGPCATYPDTAYFNVEYDSVAGYTCTRPTGCKLYEFDINTAGTLFFTWGSDTWNGITCPYIIKPVQGYNDVNYCIYNRMVAPSPTDRFGRWKVVDEGSFTSGDLSMMYEQVEYDPGSSSNGQWTFTKGTYTAVDDNRDPQCTRKYKSEGTITKDECGKELKDSEIGVTAYMPIGCNVLNGWSGVSTAAKAESCYFNYTSSTIHAIMPKSVLTGNLVLDGEYVEDNMTCYKYTTPKWTESSFTKCAYVYEDISSMNHPHGLPNGYGGTNDTMVSCSDSTKGDAKTGSAQACGDYQKVLIAKKPVGCNAEAGWFDKVTTSDTAQGIIDGAINQKYFSRRYAYTTNTFSGRECFDQACYQPVAPRCTASSDIFTVVKVEAIGGSSTCSKGTLTASYATGCNTEKGYYPNIGYDDDPTKALIDENTLNTNYFNYETITIVPGDNCDFPEITCYHPISCEQTDHPYWCNTTTVQDHGVSCSIDNGCKDPADSRFFELTTRTCEQGSPIQCSYVATGSRCPNEGNSTIFTWATTSTTNSVQKLSDTNYTAIYPTGCNATNRYYATSVTNVCSSSYFNFGTTETANECEHKVYCRHYDGCAQKPDTCIVTTRNESCSGTVASCDVAHSCKTAPSSTYFTTASKTINELGGTSCTYATGPACTQDEPYKYSYGSTSVSCASEWATDSEYFAYYPTGCNTNYHYYERSEINGKYDENYYIFGDTQKGTGCGWTAYCREFLGCKDTSTPNTCLLMIADEGFYEPVTRDTTYCKYKCKPFSGTWAEKYFESDTRTSKGITCKIAIGPKCANKYDESIYNWSSTSLTGNCSRSSNHIAKETPANMTSYYISSCKYNCNSTAFKCDGTTTTDSNCNPNNISCTTPTGCADGWQEEPCDEDHYAATSATDPVTGLTCRVCVSAWSIKSLKVNMVPEHYTTTTDDTTKEHIKITELSYMAKLEHRSTGEVIYTSDITNLSKKPFIITTTAVTTSGNNKGPNGKCTTGGLCTADPTDKVVCEKTMEASGEGIADIKCAVSSCTAKNGTSSVAVYVNYGGETLLTNIQSSQSLECEVNNCTSSCSCFGLKSSCSSDENPTAVTTPAGTCYICKPKPCECPAYYSPNKPDDAFDYITTSKTCSSETLECYQVTGCSGDWQEDTPPTCVSVEPKTDPVSGLTCYLPLGCTPPYQEATCTGTTQNTCSYGNKICYKCADCDCGSGWTDKIPGDEENFLFKISSKVVCGKTCYQATACQNYAGSGYTDCQRTMTGRTCGVNAPDNLSVAGGGYGWAGGLADINYFDITAMYGYKANTDKKISFTRADIRCGSGASSNFATSKNLKTWSDVGTNCPVNQSAFMYVDGAETWGTQNFAQEATKYETEFEIHDNEGNNICTITKKVCLNGCTCVPTCKTVGAVDKCDSGEVGTKVEVDPCGTGNKITCYEDCHVPQLPTHFIMDMSFTKSNFVCATNKYNYLASGTGYYRDKAYNKINFSDVRFDKAGGMNDINTGAYDNGGVPMSDTIVLRNYVKEDGIQKSFGFYDINPKAGSYSTSNFYTNPADSSICLASENSLKNNSTFAIGWNSAGSYKDFGVYYFADIYNFCYPLGSCENYWWSSWGTPNNMAAWTYLSYKPLTIAQDISVDTTTYSFNEGDECKFYQNASDAKKVNNGSETASGGSSNILTGTFLYNLPENMSNYFNYTYIAPCYAGISCRTDNMFARVEELIDKETDADTRRDELENLARVKEFYNIDSKTVAGKTCSTINGCNTARGCLSLAGMEAAGFDMNDPDYAWVDDYTIANDVVLETNWMVPGVEEILKTGTENIKCFCPNTDSCKVQNYSTVKECKDAGKGFIRKSNQGTDSDCAVCVTCEDDYGLKSEVESCQICKTELKDSQIATGVENLTCYKECRNKVCSDFTNDSGIPLTDKCPLNQIGGDDIYFDECPGLLCLDPDLCRYSDGVGRYGIALKLEYNDTCHPTSFTIKYKGTSSVTGNTSGITDFWENWYKSNTTKIEGMGAGDTYAWNNHPEESWDSAWGTNAFKGISQSFNFSEFPFGWKTLMQSEINSTTCTVTDGDENVNSTNETNRNKAVDKCTLLAAQQALHTILNGKAIPESPKSFASSDDFTQADLMNFYYYGISITERDYLCGVDGGSCAECSCSNRGLYDKTEKDAQLAAGKCCREVEGCYDCQAPVDYTVGTGVSGAGNNSANYWIKCPKYSTADPTIPQRIKLTNYKVGNGGTVNNPITCQGITTEADITVSGSNGSNEFCVYEIEPYPFKDAGGLSTNDTFWMSGTKLDGTIEYKCYKLKIENNACDHPVDTYDINVNTLVLREKHADYDDEQYIYSATMDAVPGIVSARFNVVYKTGEDDDLDVNVENSTLSLSDQCVPHSGKNESVCPSTTSERITKMKLYFGSTLVYESSANLPFYHNEDSNSGKSTLEFDYGRNHYRIIPSQKTEESSVETPVIITTKCEEAKINGEENLKYSTKCETGAADKPSVTVNTTGGSTNSITCNGEYRSIGYVKKSELNAKSLGNKIYRHTAVTYSSKQYGNGSVTDDGKYKVNIVNACKLWKLEILEGVYGRPWTIEVAAQDYTLTKTVNESGDSSHYYAVNDTHPNTALGNIVESDNIPTSQTVNIIKPTFTIDCDNKTYEMKDYKESNRYHVSHTVSNLNTATDVCTLTLDARGDGSTSTCSDYSTSIVTYYDATEAATQIHNGKDCNPVNSELVGGLECYTCSDVRTIDTLVVHVETDYTTTTFKDEEKISKIWYELKLSDGTKLPMTNIHNDDTISIKVTANAPNFTYFANNCTKGDCGTIGYTICSVNHKASAQGEQEACQLLNSCNAWINNNPKINTNSYTVSGVIGSYKSKTFNPGEKLECVVLGTIDDGNIHEPDNPNPNEPIPPEYYAKLKITANSNDSILSGYRINVAYVVSIKMDGLEDAMIEPRSVDVSGFSIQFYPWFGNISHHFMQASCLASTAGGTAGYCGDQGNESQGLSWGEGNDTDPYGVKGLTKCEAKLLQTLKVTGANGKTYTIEPGDVECVVPGGNNNGNNNGGGTGGGNSGGLQPIDKPIQQ